MICHWNLEGFSIIKDKYDINVNLMQSLQIQTGARAYDEVQDDDNFVDGTWIEDFGFKTN